jgi:hypothetical protein
VHHARGEKAGLAGFHFELLAADLDVRAAFKEIAHLLDAGMQVRQRAFALFQLADDDFELPRAHGLRADEAEVLRAGVIGR